MESYFTKAEFRFLDFFSCCLSYYSTQFSFIITSMLMLMLMI